MGATLPAIARWVRTNPEGLSRMGLFYGMNTLGAVLGCFIAGFLLLPQTDLSYASGVAAAVNAIVGLTALSMASSLPYAAAGGQAEQTTAVEPRRRNVAAVYVVVGLSGFTALSAEVIWTRLLALLYGATTYTFAIILMFGVPGGHWCGQYSRRTPVQAHDATAALAGSVSVWIGLGIVGGASQHLASGAVLAAGRLGRVLRVWRVLTRHLTHLSNCLSASHVVGCEFLLRTGSSGAGPAGRRQARWEGRTQPTRAGRSSGAADKPVVGAGRWLAASAAVDGRCFWSCGSARTLGRDTCGCRSTSPAP